MEKQIVNVEKMDELAVIDQKRMLELEKLRGL